MTEPTETDFDGCHRACRVKQKHTLQWGGCEHATPPEPTVSMSKVYTDTDGCPSIGFDVYTVPQLAELIPAGLRASDLPVDADDFVDIACVAAQAIVHRNDGQPPAAPAGPAPATERAALRERIRLAIARQFLDETGSGRTVEELDDAEFASVADAVLAVLPAPDQQTAVLTEAAASLLARCPHLGRPGPLPKCPCAAAEELLRMASREPGVADYDTLREEVLRRLAGEAQQDEAGGRAAACRCHSREGLTPQQHENDCPLAQPAREARQDPTQDGTEAHPAEHRWMAELYDPVADEWVPGTRYLDRDRAVKHLDHANAIGPRWKDGTPVERRIVRETTTYTVEHPDAVERSGQPETDGQTQQSKDAS